MYVAGRLGGQAEVWYLRRDRLLITSFFGRVRPHVWGDRLAGHHPEVTSSLLLLVERRLLPAAHVGRSLKFFEGPSAGFF